MPVYSKMYRIACVVYVWLHSLYNKTLTVRNVQSRPSQQKILFSAYIFDFQTKVTRRIDVQSYNPLIPNASRPTNAVAAPARSSAGVLPTVPLANPNAMLAISTQSVPMLAHRALLISRRPPSVAVLSSAVMRSSPITRSRIPKRRGRIV